MKKSYSYSTKKEMGYSVGSIVQFSGRLTRGVLKTGTIKEIGIGRYITIEDTTGRYHYVDPREIKRVV